MKLLFILPRLVLIHDELEINFVFRKTPRDLFWVLYSVWRHQQSQCIRLLDAIELSLGRDTSSPSYLFLPSLIRPDSNSYLTVLAFNNFFNTSTSSPCRHRVMHEVPVVSACHLRKLFVADVNHRNRDHYLNRGDRLMKVVFRGIYLEH